MGFAAARLFCVKRRGSSLACLFNCIGFGNKCEGGRAKPRGKSEIRAGVADASAPVWDELPHADSMMASGAPNFQRTRRMIVSRIDFEAADSPLHCSKPLDRPPMERARSAELQGRPMMRVKPCD